MNQVVSTDRRHFDSCYVFAQLLSLLLAPPFLVSKERFLASNDFYDKLVRMELHVVGGKQTLALSAPLCCTSLFRDVGNYH